MKLDILVENNKFYDSLHNLCFYLDTQIYNSLRQ